jgi:hypothetical protein
MRSERILLAVYVTWAAAVYGIVLLKDGLSPDNITHLGILAYLGATAFAVPLLRRLSERYSPRRVFIVTSVISAAVVETCYMISTPLHPSLRITAATSAGDALRNVAVDLSLTFPAYVMIFLAVWWLIRRYDYRPVEFAIVVSAGQALGDGMGYFPANPAMLIFIPYIMVNYQAMTLVPYVALRGRIPPEGRRRQPLMFVLPLIVLPLVYLVAGSIIITLGRALHWIS